MSVVGEHCSHPFVSLYWLTLAPEQEPEWEELFFLTLHSVQKKNGGTVQHCYQRSQSTVLIMPTNYGSKAQSSRWIRYQPCRGFTRCVVEQCNIQVPPRTRRDSEPQTRCLAPFTLFRSTRWFHPDTFNMISGLLKEARTDPQRSSWSPVMTQHRALVVSQCLS